MATGTERCSVVRSSMANELELFHLREKCRPGFLSLLMCGCHTRAKLIPAFDRIHPQLVPEFGPHGSTESVLVNDA